MAILFATLAIAAPSDATANTDASMNPEVDHRRCRPRYDECIEFSTNCKPVTESWPQSGSFKSEAQGKYMYKRG
ncbi:hypothetical protein N7540_011505 [Penicillium herquei]|nr:hypothetical protein N7540_011505 [Penicillium herquei]